MNSSHIRMLQHDNNTPFQESSFLPTLNGECFSCGSDLMILSASQVAIGQLDERNHWQEQEAARFWFLNRIDHCRRVFRPDDKQVVISNGKDSWVLLNKPDQGQWQKIDSGHLDGKNLWFSSDSRTMMTAPFKPAAGVPVSVTLHDCNDSEYEEEVILTGFLQQSTIVSCYKYSDSQIVVEVKPPHHTRAEDERPGLTESEPEEGHENSSLAILQKNEAGQWVKKSTSTLPGVILGVTPDGSTWITQSEYSPKHICIWRPDGTGQWEKKTDFCCKTDALKVFFGNNLILIEMANRVEMYAPDHKGGWLLANVLEYSGRVLSLSFSPDNRRLLTLTSDHVVRIWETDGKGSNKWSLKGDFTARSESKSALFSPDGRYVYVTDLRSGGHGDVWEVLPKKYVHNNFWTTLARIFNKERQVPPNQLV